jgi:hypothetical protein
MLKFISTVLATLTIASTALAGGIIPSNWGMLQSGMRMIPDSASLIRYDYYGALTPEVVDNITYAVATIDVETTAYQLLYGKVLSEVAPTNTVLRFKGVNDPVDAGCLPGNPAGCNYAQASCDAYYAATGPYRRCYAYKVILEMGNIYYKATELGLDQEEFAAWMQSIVRHEVTHVLGFSHTSDVVPEGPMIDGKKPLSSCQLAVLEGYQNLPGVTMWAVISSCIQTNP